ncbi:MAG: M48 family metallopeptidase [Proteobacteria bacterium]|nr:M48 family metallopeptidase [Pseudomonadota bacterium]MCP4921467.1 M48 family metallopeptidase [Pseudomonadota bacterium]
MLEQLKSLRFSYEAELFGSLRNILGEELTGKSDHVVREQFHARKRHLLGDAVRITADLLPGVHGQYQRCLEMVGGDLVGDLYVVQSPEYNANILAHGKRFDLLVHSSLLQDFDTDELNFVIGHELGHVIFEHSNFSIHEVFQKKEGQVDPMTAQKMMAWSRAAEVSADRIGMLTCGSLGSAITALFKTSSGLKGISEDAMLRSFRQQYDELVAHMGDRGQGHEWVRTHPMIPIRFKAIELAALDLVSIRNSRAAFSSRGFRRVDQTISSILTELDNQKVQSRMKKLPQNNQQLACLIVLLFVALADGALDSGERMTITDVHRGLDCQAPLDQMLNQATSNRSQFMSAAEGEIRNRAGRLHPDDVALILLMGAALAIHNGGISPLVRQTLHKCALALYADPGDCEKAIKAIEGTRQTAQAVLRD